MIMTIDISTNISNYKLYSCVYLLLICLLTLNLSVKSMECPESFSSSACTNLLNPSENILLNEVCIIVQYASECSVKSYCEVEMTKDASTSSDICDYANLLISFCELFEGLEECQKYFQNSIKCSKF